MGSRCVRVRRDRGLLVEAEPVLPKDLDAVVALSFVHLLLLLSGPRIVHCLGHLSFLALTELSRDL